MGKNKKNRSQKIVPKINCSLDGKATKTILLTIEQQQKRVQKLPLIKLTLDDNNYNNCNDNSNKNSETSDDDADKKVANDSGFGGDEEEVDEDAILPDFGGDDDGEGPASAFSQPINDPSPPKMCLSRSSSLSSLFSAETECDRKQKEGGLRGAPSAAANNSNRWSWMWGGKKEEDCSYFNGEEFVPDFVALARPKDPSSQVKGLKSIEEEEHENHKNQNKDPAKTTSNKINKDQKHEDSSNEPKKNVGKQKKNKKSSSPCLQKGHNEAPINGKKIDPNKCVEQIKKIVERLDKETPCFNEQLLQLLDRSETDSCLLFDCYLSERKLVEDCVDRLLQLSFSHAPTTVEGETSPTAGPIAELRRGTTRLVELAEALACAVDLVSAENDIPDLVYANSPYFFGEAKERWTENLKLHSNGFTSLLWRQPTCSKGELVEAFGVFCKSVHRDYANQMRNAKNSLELKELLEENMKRKWPDRYAFEGL